MFDEILNKLPQVPQEFWSVLSEMAPYLLFGFLMAGVLAVFISPELVERHLGGGRLSSVIKAAAFGVPLPLCSCGVIPVAASLRGHGASKGATTAFLISTPQTGVDSILVTFSLLGPVYAIFRPLVALVSGILGGVLVTAGERRSDRPAHRPQCQEACCAPGQQGKGRRAMPHGFVALPRDIGKALLVGVAIAAVISTWSSGLKNLHGGLLGGGVTAMLIMMAVGIPIYVCATASVPIAAAMILEAGVSPGAALVFLMTGPATNAATIATIWKVLGPRTAAIYLLTMAATALAAGIALDYVFTIEGVPPVQPLPWMLPVWVGWTSAVVLLGVLGVALLRRRPAATAHDDSQHDQECHHDH